MSRLCLLGRTVLLAGAILIAPAGGAGAAVTVGISDQRAQTFADARLRALSRARRPGRPPMTETGDHLFWITSRAAGITALLLASAAVAAGLLIGSRTVRGPRAADILVLLIARLGLRSGRLLPTPTPTPDPRGQP